MYIQGMQRPHSSSHISGRRVNKNRTARLHFSNSNYDVNLFYSQLRNRASTAATEEAVVDTTGPLYQNLPPGIPHSSRPGSPSMFIVSAGRRRHNHLQSSPISTVKKAQPHRIFTVGSVGLISLDCQKKNIHSFADLV